MEYPEINDFTNERVNEAEIKQLIKKIKWISFVPESRYVRHPGIYCEIE